MCASISGLYSVTLIYLPIFMSVPHCFDYYLKTKSGSIIPLSLFFFQRFLTILGLLNFHLNFRVNLSNFTRGGGRKPILMALC